MDIYLIRHTRPLVATGICYGQTDLDVVDTFEEEAAVIKNLLPPGIQNAYSSPLLRCRLLAEHLFLPPIQYYDDLMELDCGRWEMQHWDEIPKRELQVWLQNIVAVKVPDGESYADLFTRTVQRYEIISGQEKPAAIVAHGGVIRSILAHISNTPLIEAFDRFRFFYGAVIKINTVSGEIETLSNIEVTGEQHRPSDWVK